MGLLWEKSFYVQILVRELPASVQSDVVQPAGETDASVNQSWANSQFLFAGFVFVVPGLCSPLHPSSLSSALQCWMKNQPGYEFRSSNFGFFLAGNIVSRSEEQCLIPDATLAPLCYEICRWFDRNTLRNCQTPCCLPY